MSLKRRLPRNSSRMTSSDHFSPTTSRAEATEQRRGVAVRVAGLTAQSVAHRVGKSNRTAYGSRDAGLETPTEDPAEPDQSIAEPEPRQRRTGPGGPT